MSDIFREQISTTDFQDESNPFLIPIGVSNRHLHISEKDFETIFGAGKTLTSMKDLSQPGQFACQETVHVVGPKGMIENMRILGPFRGQTQIEVSQTDARKLGIQPPLRHSGDLAGTPGCVLVGPKGYVVLDSGCILAKTHIHMSLEEGARLGVSDKELVDVYVKSERPLCFIDVMARVHKDYRLDFHIDTDEANAAGVKTGDKVLLIKK